HEYLEQFYLPAAKGHLGRQADNGQLARALYQWHQRLTQHWHEIHMGELQTREKQVQLTVHLGGLQADDIKVQLIADPAIDSQGNKLPAQIIDMQLLNNLGSGTHAYRYTAPLPDKRS